MIYDFYLLKIPSHVSDGKSSGVEFRFLSPSLSRCFFARLTKICRTPAASG